MSNLKQENPLHLDLQMTLREKVNYYLENDNKEPKTTYDFVSRFFSSSGAYGRGVAIGYRKTVIDNYCGEILLHRVYSDLFADKGVFSSSRKLKYRLLEGICAYLGLETQVQEIYQQRLDAWRAMTLENVGIPPQVEEKDYDLLRMNVMVSLIHRVMDGDNESFTKDINQFFPLRR